MELEFGRFLQTLDKAFFVKISLKVIFICNSLQLLSFPGSVSRQRLRHRLGENLVSGVRVGDISLQLGLKQI